VECRGRGKQNQCRKPESPPLKTEGSVYLIEKIIKKYFKDDEEKGVGKGEARPTAKKDVRELGHVRLFEQFCCFLTGLTIHASCIFHKASIWRRPGVSLSWPYCRGSGQ
jgi:hypothetical protein